MRVQHSPSATCMGVHSGTDCTLGARKGKSVVPLQLCLAMACTNSMAALRKGHAGHGKQHVVSDYLCLIAHTKASNTWSFLVYSESTAFKTLKSMARMMGLDASIPLEVHTEVDGWLDKYRKRQQQGQLARRSHVKKEPGTQPPPPPRHPTDPTSGAHSGRAGTIAEAYGRTSTRDGIPQQAPCAGKPHLWFSGCVGCKCLGFATGR